MTENHSNLVNLSTYTTRPTKNGNQGQSWDKIKKKLNQEHTQFTRATKNIGGRENIWRYENIQSELLQTHRRVAPPPTSQQRSTSWSQAVNPRTTTTRIYRHRMKHHAIQHGAILINKGLNNQHLQEPRPQCKNYMLWENSQKAWETYRWIWTLSPQSKH